MSVSSHPVLSYIRDSVPDDKRKKKKRKRDDDSDDDLGINSYTLTYRHGTYLAFRIT